MSIGPLHEAGSKIIQIETGQEWLQIGWHEFHEQYLAIEEKIRAKRFDTNGIDGDISCRLKLFDDVSYRARFASRFARDAWIILGDVAVVRATFAVLGLIPDWLELCCTNTTYVGVTCPVTWIYSFSSRIFRRTNMQLLGTDKQTNGKDLTVFLSRMSQHSRRTMSDYGDEDEAPQERAAEA